MWWSRRQFVERRGTRRAAEDGELVVTAGLGAAPRRHEAIERVAATTRPGTRSRLERRGRRGAVAALVRAPPAVAGLAQRERARERRERRIEMIDVDATPALGRAAWRAAHKRRRDPTATVASVGSGTVRRERARAAGAQQQRVHATRSREASTAEGSGPPGPGAPEQRRDGRHAEAKVVRGGHRGSAGRGESSSSSSNSSSNSDVLYAGALWRTTKAV
jgi:hypothetical protein